MPRTPTPRVPTAKQVAAQAAAPAPLKPAKLVKGPSLPHERDEAAGEVAATPDPVIVQAKKDIDAGLVDTDMRATPGLDAARRARLVPAAPEPGTKMPVSDRPAAPRRRR